jgi:hypothetical protein
METRVVKEGDACGGRNESLQNCADCGSTRLWIEKCTDRTALTFHTSE